MPRFPKKVFIQAIEDEDNDENLCTYRDIENTEDGPLAVYELKKVGKKKTVTVFE